MPTTAVLLAAGRGSRLRNLTDDMPKPLMHLGGRTLLDRGLESIAAAGIEDVIVVTGYRANAIESLDLSQYGQRVRLAHNADWNTSGIVASFVSANPHRLGTDVMMVYGDIIYEPKTISAALVSGACPLGVTVPINTEWETLWSARMDDVYADAESLVLDHDGAILEIGQPAANPARIDGQFMGVVFLDARTTTELVHHYQRQRQQVGAPHPRRWDTTRLLTSWIEDGQRVQSVPVSGGWLEVDTVEDLEVYERLHNAGKLWQFCRLS